MHQRLPPNSPVQRLKFANKSDAIKRQCNASTTPCLFATSGKSGRELRKFSSALECAINAPLVQGCAGGANDAVFALTVRSGGSGSHYTNFQKVSVAAKAVWRGLSNFASVGDDCEEGVETGQDALLTDARLLQEGGGCIREVQTKRFTSESSSGIGSMDSSEGYGIARKRNTQRWRRRSGATEVSSGIESDYEANCSTCIRSSNVGVSIAAGEPSVKDTQSDSNPQFLARIKKWTDSERRNSASGSKDGDSAALSEGPVDAGSRAAVPSFSRDGHLTSLPIDIPRKREKRWETAEDFSTFPWQVLAGHELDVKPHPNRCRRLALSRSFHARQQQAADGAL